jgi:peptidoglycan hydrolase-like amidase
MITRRSFLAGSLASLATAADHTNYSFWVFGLLHPTMIIVRPQPNSILHSGSIVLEGTQQVRVDMSHAPMSFAGPNNTPASFVLEIPGVIRRRYLGVLSITSNRKLLRAVVSIDREVAVGSIVGAELPVQGTPMAALSAQALATRSFLQAAGSHPRHAGAQFCDTTHCQFLRAPAPDGSLVERAVGATRQIVLSSESSVIPAHYSAACGGRTDSAVLDHYQYRSVVCQPCRSAGVARRGHGLGLCQTGAISLARSGWTWQEIVAKYYPGCAIRNA